MGENNYGKTMEDKYLTRSYGSVNTAPGIITSFHSRFTIFFVTNKGATKGNAAMEAMWNCFQRCSNGK